MNNLNENGAALICIPDITGFTQFMAENHIEVSRKIIPPLLRTIVNTNSINMQVGEIEGDAVVFYRFGILPTLNELVMQCVNFYDKFHESLEILLKENSTGDQQTASSENLSLKIICHAAEITSTQIEGITKLIGEDMVVVHKLLKNSVPAMEYILMSDKLLSRYSEEEKKTALENHKLIPGNDEYDHIGKINYQYILFSE